MTSDRASTFADPLDYHRRCADAYAQEVIRYAGHFADLIGARDDDAAEPMRLRMIEAANRVNLHMRNLAAARKAQPAETAAAFFDRLGLEATVGG